MITFSKTNSDAYSSKNNWIGIAFTILLIGLGVYLIVKHFKEPIFWYGFIALFLLGSSITISKDNNTATNTNTVTDTNTSTNINTTT